MPPGKNTDESSWCNALKGWQGSDSDKKVFPENSANAVVPCSYGDEPSSPRSPLQGDSAREFESEEQRDNAKYHNGITGQIAKNKKFEAITICVIMLNALEIGWDADYSARYYKPENLYEGPIEFIICECAFAAYFTLEILIRFLGYAKKSNLIFDFWFVFDGILVTFMVAETWVLPLMSDGSPLGQLSILRLLRLLRITRMAKLMRACPELLMIIKGIKTALKAVVWTAILLVIITYTCAILFTNEYHQGNRTDDELEAGEAAEFFGSMQKSMLSLLVMGTILDDVTACSDVIRATNNFTMQVAFIMYILLNSFTMLNMLVGILVDVVANTADSEKKRLLEEGVTESITSIFQQMDKDRSGKITRLEFMEMRRHKTVMQALSDLEIREKQFDMYTDLLFEPNEANDNPSISFDKLLNMILRLRPGNNVSSLDFAAFKRIVTEGSCSVTQGLERIAARCSPSDSEKMGKASPSGHAVVAWGVPTADQPEKKDEVAVFPQDALKPPASQRINIQMLEHLEQTHSVDIIKELAGRLKVPNLEETGVPLEMMDDELRQRVRAAEAYPVIGVPQDTEWSKETLTC